MFDWDKKKGQGKAKVDSQSLRFSIPGENDLLQCCYWPYCERVDLE